MTAGQCWAVDPSGSPASTRAARPGRKMGQVTCLGASIAAALATARTIREELGIDG